MPPRIIRIGRGGITKRGARLMAWPKQNRPGLDVAGPDPEGAAVVTLAQATQIFDEALTYARNENLAPITVGCSMPVAAWWS